MPARNTYTPLLIMLAGALFFIPFLGAVHLFDWDEINFAESAREMMVTGDYTKVQINYLPFPEKPPLFFWLQAVSMHLFGVNEFAARLPNAITGIITLLTLYMIGKKYYSSRFGLLWALCMLGSFLPHLYFKSGIIDPVFNFFIFMGIFFLIQLAAQGNKSTRMKYSVYSGIFIGLGTLTKGPVALLILLLCAAVYWICKSFRRFPAFREWLLFFIAFFLVSGIWFAIDIWENGIGIFGQFILYQLELLTQPVAGHGGPWYYHFVVVAVGCFPVSIIALPALFKNSFQKDSVDFHRWMQILFWSVIILFSLVTTKIVHYSSLTYFPLAFLAARVLDDVLLHTKRLARWQLFLLGLTGSFFAILLAGVPWLAQRKELLIPYLDDPFAVDCLRTDVQWNGSEILIGILYLLCLLIAVVLLFAAKNKQGIIVLFLSTALCMFVYLKAVVPKIEAYSQGPAIRFYQSLQGKSVYVIPLGFKSYAHYFYFQKPAGDKLQSNNEEWLLRGEVDRPAYFVLKTTSMSRMEEYEDVRFIRKEGGFAFYVREPALKVP